MLSNIVYLVEITKLYTYFSVADVMKHVSFYFHFVIIFQFCISLHKHFVNSGCKITYKKM